MIAIDTNVLLRYLLRDDESQAARADPLVNGDETVLITDVVLAETVWTLVGNKYHYDKADIVMALEKLFSEPKIRFEDDQAVWRALQAFRNSPSDEVGGGRKEAGFADALIVYKALSVAALSGDALQSIYTFDMAALQLPHTQLPKPVRRAPV